MSARVTALILVCLMILAVNPGCKKNRPPATGPTVSVVCPGLTATRGITRSHASRFAPDNCTVYLYTFTAKETFPHESLYEEDDFFIEINIAGPLGRVIATNEYFDEQVTCWIHTAERTQMMKKKKGILAITTLTADTIAGNVTFDDGESRVKGSFSANLKNEPK